MVTQLVPVKDPPRRLAILKPSALGDIAHSLPVLSALRQRFPNSHISWIINCSYASILEGHPDLNEIVTFDRSALRKTWIGGSITFLRFLRHLRAQRYDMVIDLQGLFRTGLMTLATGAPIRIGLASAREGARFFYNHRVDDQTDVTHAVDRYWRVIEALGDAPAIKTFHVPVQAAARHWAQERLKPFPRPWLTIGVGSRWLTKRWLPAHFASLVEQAQGQFGGTAIFIGTHEEAPLAQQAADLVHGPKCQLAGATNLSQLVGVLAESDVMIANDTGPLHLAAALGRPVVAPYTCTRVDKTGPYGQLERGIQTSVWCRGSCLKRCPVMDCMAELTPDRLWPALEMILQPWQQQQHAA